MMQIYAMLPEELSLAGVPDFARRVEAMGFDGIMVPETIHDGFLMSCQALAATKRIHVTISALIVFPRSPMHVALAAWDLQRMSGGRFQLCLGSQIRQNIEDRFSARWLPPVAGIREYVSALRAIFHSFRTGEPLNFVGEYYRFTRLQPYFNPGPIEAPDVSIATGGVGPRMLALAGEIADELHTHVTSSSPRFLREYVIPGMMVGVEHRAPNLGKPFIQTPIFVATGPDEEAVAKDRERCRSTLSFLFSTPQYWKSLEICGWQHIGEELRQLTREKRWKDMPGVLNEAVMEEFINTATYSNLAGVLQRRYDGVVDRIAMIIGNDDPKLDAQLGDAVAALKAR